MAVAGVATGQVAVIVWGAAVAAIGAAASAWTRVAWKGVTVDVEFSPPRGFIGEPVTISVRITNRKRTPLPLVRIKVWLPPALLPTEETPDPTVRGFYRRLFLGGHSEAILELPVQVLRRGEFAIERVEVDLSDPFDLAPLHREEVPGGDLLVMPEPRIPVPVEVLRRLPFGQPVRASRMFEDRERFAGIRPYEPGDPLSRIHWRMTGHTGQLQTKLFEPTRSADVLFALDLSLGEPFWDSVYPDIAEDTIGWASFLARQAVQSGWRAGLIANTHLTRGRGPLRVPASSPGRGEAALFAALARMPNEPTSDLAPVLREAARSFGRSTTAVVVSPRPGPWLLQEIRALRSRGTPVVHLSPLNPSAVDVA